MKMVLLIAAALVVARVIAGCTGPAENPNIPQARVSMEIGGAPFGLQAAVMVLPDGSRVLVLYERNGSFGTMAVASTLLPRQEVKP